MAGTESSKHSEAPLLDPPSSYSVEHTLAQELLKLSFKDRQNLEEEIHGVYCGSVKETPELIKTSLQRFDEIVNARKQEHSVLRNIICTTGLTSRSESECYLNHDNTRLIFLRAKCFDVEAAVIQFINFLEFMCFLFGDFIAERPARITDFKTTDELKALQNSRCQYLPFRDRSGRRVLCAVGNCDFHRGSLRYKIVMFLHWSIIAKDVETQQKGVVVIGYIYDESNTDATWEILRPSLKNSARELNQRLYKSMPIRMVSMHQCGPDTPFFHTLGKIYAFGLDSYHRSIYRSHFGERTELLYKLSTYGIPSALVQISHTGTVKMSNHATFLKIIEAETLQAMSKKPRNEEIVECPASYDVIFRKGPTYRNNPGNEFYRDLLEKYSDQHVASKSKKEKYSLTMCIVNAVENRNGRFLQWSTRDQVWTVMTDRNKIREKVAAGLKQYNRRKAKLTQKVAHNGSGKRDLERALADATAILQDHDFDGVSATPETHDLEPTSRLSKDFDDAKRRKLCSGFGDEADTTGDIFGRRFFPCE